MSARDAVARAARQLAEAGLLIGTAGNVSVREGDLVAVTATGVELGTCSPSQVTLVALDGEVVDGSLAPTSELDLHLGVYADTDAAAVVHTHAPWSTAVACVLDELPVIHYQQLLLGGAVRVAPYATFGSQELAANVLDALDGRSAALMANHGAITVAGDAPAAVEASLLLEWACTLYWTASAIGSPRSLDEEERQAVIDAVVARGYGATRRLEEA